jgi:hypothetical protein
MNPKKQSVHDRKNKKKILYIYVFRCFLAEIQNMYELVTSPGVRILEAKKFVVLLWRV